MLHTYTGKNRWARAIARHLRLPSAMSYIRPELMSKAGRMEGALETIFVDRTRHSICDSKY